VITHARWLVLLAFASVGCVPAAERRAGHWWIVDTSHVLLETNVSQRRARDTAWAMEDLHQALAHVFERYPCGDEVAALHTNATLIANEHDFEDFAPAGSGAFYSIGYRGLVTVEPRMIVPMSARYSVGNTVAQRFVHELTHRFVAECFPGIPPWLNEGLASLYETMRVHDRDIEVGIAPYQIRGSGSIIAFRESGVSFVRVPFDVLPDVPALLGMAPDAFYDASSDRQRLGHYAASWALVHMLAIGHGQGSALDDHLDAIARGTEPAASIDTTLGDPDALNAAMIAYVAQGEWLERHVAYSAIGSHLVHAAPLEPWRAHLAWAELALLGRPEARALGRKHAIRAQATPSGLVRGLLLEAALVDEPLRSDVFARAYAAAPESLDVVRAEGWRARSGPAQRRAAVIASLVARRDLRSEDRLVLAELQLANGDPASALDNALAVARAGTGTWQAHAILGRAYQAIGDVARARTELARALDMTAHDASSAARELSALLDALPSGALAPTVVAPGALGSLSREVIRTVIRSHLAEVRTCYETALAGGTFESRVVVGFVIAVDGHVATATIEDSSPGHAAMDACIVDAVRGWTFPAPEGHGVVGVSYPFVFDTTEGSHAPPSETTSTGVGTFDQQAVVRMIQTRRSAIQSCYERELRTTHTLAGRIAIAMTILEDGSVSNVHAALNEMAGGEVVEACLVRVVEQFHFDPGPTGGSVTYTFPFVFMPQS
jgi:TonB family protein